MKRFTKQLLSDTEEMTAYFTELSRQCEIAELWAYDDRTDRRTPELGLVLQNVIAVNRCFNSTYSLNEYLLNKALIRQQLQNLVYLFAEIKNPFKVIRYICYKGKSFNQLGLPSFTSFLEELEPEYSGLKDLWTDSCSYVHPSGSNYDISTSEHSLRLLAGLDWNKQRKKTAPVLKNFIKQREKERREQMAATLKAMYQLNLLIIKITNQGLQKMKDKIYQSEKLKRNYSRSLKEVQATIKI